MGSKGDPYEHACAEGFFPTLKTELIHGTRFNTRDEARLSIFRYIEGFYDPRRRLRPLATRALRSMRGCFGHLWR
ncbi:IS3 family transposase [Candidatus Solincola tengchongensis]|uniref:IS3 family transposase n=1 Tax=Candidatus Solincola tengchongensis TaxID=2900693 RepID=UPI003313060C